MAVTDMNKLDLAAARYNSASNNLIDRIDRYNTRFYGVRCDEYEAGCPICDIWKMRDELKKFICE